MQLEAEFMALSLTRNVRITVDGKEVWAVQGDVLVDSLDGKRRLLHKIEFEQLVKENGYTVSQDRGHGWVVCRKSG